MFLRAHEAAAGLGQHGWHPGLAMVVESGCSVCHPEQFSFELQ